MKLGEFLKDKWISFLLMLAVLITIEIFVIPFQRTWIQVYIFCVIVLSYIAVITIEYIKKKTFYHELIKKIEKLEQAYLIAEMIDNPTFYEAQLLKEILQDTAKSMHENVNTFKFQLEEYKDYIELWIHEIKTPISVTKMIIENNKNEVTNNIEEEIDKIENFVEQSLYYARSNHTEKDYIIKQVNLDTIVKDVISKHKKAILSQKIEIEIKDTDKSVFTDSKWLNFILSQIINNCIKYKKEENSKIQIYSLENKDNIILEIQDNGIGIKEKELEKVFDKGFTGTNGRIKEKTTGIGLYLCKKLCDKLGHSIEIDAKENEYTKVKIIFPKNSFVSF